MNNFTWNWLVELLDTCKIGINLTISNISNTLILGFGRIIVDKKWKLVTFGKISLAISLTNFLMQFMQQISMVLFPALRQSTKDFQKDLYDVLFDTIGIVLCGSYILYFPLEMALSKWLPQYSDSFVYLGVLLPICCYDGKVYVLYNTYMKVLRKEKYILKINVLSCILSFVLSVTFSSVFNSIIPVILAIVLTICFRNFAFGYILTANKNRYYLIFGMETMLSLVFELLCFCTTKPVAVITYSFIYCIVILIHRNSFLQLKSFLGHEK